MISMHQPPDLRPARRPRGLQLPDPAPRRGRPDLRLPHRPPLHHRPGADVLQQPRPTSLVRHDPRPIGKSNYSMMPDPAPGADDPVQLLVVPAARRRRCSASASPACSFLLGALLPRPGLLRATPTSRAGPRSWCCSRSSTASSIALLSMLGEYVVRTLNAVSAEEHLPRDQRAGLRVTRAPPRASAPSGAARRTSTTCSTPTPRSRWPGPPGPSRRCSSPTSSPAAAPEWYRATYFAHADRRAAARREEHQLPRGRRGAGPRRRGARRPARRGRAARPGRSGRSRNWRFSTDHGLETATARGRRCAPT